MELWIPLVATAVGVTLGAILTIVTHSIEHRRKRNHDSSTVRREKLEDLYETLSDTWEHYRMMLTRYSYLMMPEELFESERQSARLTKTDRTLPFSKLQMLTSIYGPDLKHHIDKIISQRNVVGKSAVAAIKSGDLTEQQRRELWERLCNELEEMENIINAAQHDVSFSAAELLK